MSETIVSTECILRIKTNFEQKCVTLFIKIIKITSLENIDKSFCSTVSKKNPKKIYHHKTGAIHLTISFHMILYQTNHEFKYIHNRKKV